MSDIDGLLAGGEVAVFAAEGHPHRAAGTLVALIYPTGEVCVGQDVDDAVGAGCLNVVHSAGQRGRGPQ